MIHRYTNHRMKLVYFYIEHRTRVAFLCSPETDQNDTLLISLSFFLSLFLSWFASIATFWGRALRKSNSVRWDRKATDRTKTPQSILRLSFHQISLQFLLAVMGKKRPRSDHNPPFSPPPSGTFSFSFSYHFLYFLFFSLLCDF